MSEVEATFRVCVVPVDFEASSKVSEITKRAISMADRLTAGGALHLVHATPELTHFGLSGASQGAWFPHDSAARLNKAAKEHAGRVLTELAQSCRHAAVVLHIRPGRPLDVIVKVCDTTGADGIVLPLSGRGGVRRALLGSVADKVIRMASCPVLIVP